MGIGCPSFGSALMTEYASIGEHYKKFLEEGEEQTRKYLNNFGKLRGFLARNFIFGEGAKYKGAKKALEEMTKSSD